MTRVLAAVAAFVSLASAASAQTSSPFAQRLVILKVDGLNGDLLYNTMAQTDPATGKSKLPWLSYIFAQNGTIFRNFYTRGISLSAPSWSMLDTGHHTVIRGNVEYDRYTGEAFDYLNFFPFYIGVARSKQEDMPGVEVLDRAGIPLLIDRYSYEQVFQSPQLFARGVRWEVLDRALKARFSSKALLQTVESGAGPSLDSILGQQVEKDLMVKMAQSQVLYLDYYNGDVDHEGHASNDPAVLMAALKELDGLAGRIWNAIQSDPHGKQTLFVVVSDHGMNNTPGVYSQGYSLPGLLASPEGGAHHVVTDRFQLSDFKLRSIDPLVNRVTTPSTASFYLSGQASRYPTSWLDLDGNERASLELRNSDVNELHILLLQLAREDLAAGLRTAAARHVSEIIQCNRARWESVITGLTAELAAVQTEINRRKLQLDQLHQRKKPTKAERQSGALAADRRLLEVWKAYVTEEAEYREYLKHLQALLNLDIPSNKPFTAKISDFVPELSVGDVNSVYQLQHYVVGPAREGLVIGSDGKLDRERSFRFVDYYSLLSSATVRNNPQPALSSKPIDFVITPLPRSASTKIGDDCRYVYWVYADEQRQLLVLQRRDAQLTLRPISGLQQDADGNFSWTDIAWRADLPLKLFEDPALALPSGATRAEWLSEWHSEHDWMEAIHRCLYSNGVIGITEQFSPVANDVPGQPGISPLLLRYERRRRDLVEPDLQIFAADHWNFNARNFNPGGNHGSFLRISTHSVWMMAGFGVPARSVEEPYDSLNFASTVLERVGKDVPMPDRVVDLR